MDLKRRYVVNDGHIGRKYFTENTSGPGMLCVVLSEYLSKVTKKAKKDADDMQNIRFQRDSQDKVQKDSSDKLQRDSNNSCPFIIANELRALRYSHGLWRKKPLSRSSGYPITLVEMQNPSVDKIYQLSTSIPVTPLLIKDGSNLYIYGCPDPTWQKPNDADSMSRKISLALTSIFHAPPKLPPSSKLTLLIQNNLKEIEELKLSFSAVPYRLHPASVPSRLYTLIYKKDGHYAKHLDKQYVFDMESIPFHLMYDERLKIKKKGHYMNDNYMNNALEKNNKKNSDEKKHMTVKK